MREASCQPADHRPFAQRMRASVLGLQCKSTLLVVALTLSVSALVGGLFVHFAGRPTARIQQTHARNLAAMLADLAASPLAREDEGGLQNLADRFGRGEPLLFVAICGRDGRPLVSASKAGVPLRSFSLQEAARFRETLGQPTLRRARPGIPTFLDVSYPVNAPAGQAGCPSTLLGYVRVGFDVHTMLREFSSVMDLVMGIGLVAVLITIPLAYLVVRQIVLPLDELSRTADRLAQGNLSARSTVDRNDEIGRLARSFNHMAEVMERHESRVTALNADLEERVRRRTDQLREMALRDPLTGLHNRRHFDEVLSRSVSEARRYGTPLSCLMIDLDDFKAVNDRFGHPVGDRALILAAQTIATQLRASDVAARFGGDEFVVLLPQTDCRQAEVLSRRIADAYKTRLCESLPRVSGGLSIGVAALADTSSNAPDVLLRAADRALYHAKQRGKDRVEISSSGV